MGLNIKNEETERLARELAAATGESITSSITVAIRERLDRIDRRDEVAVELRRARIRRISEDAASRWREPYRSVEHGDMLYDSRGLPA